MSKQVFLIKRTYNSTENVMEVASSETDANRLVDFYNANFTGKYGNITYSYVSINLLTRSDISEKINNGTL